jgi:hypothetical protein
VLGWWSSCRDNDAFNTFKFNRYTSLCRHMVWIKRCATTRSRVALDISISSKKINLVKKSSSDRGIDENDGFDIKYAYTRSLMRQCRYILTACPVESRGLKLKFGDENDKIDLMLDSSSACITIPS